MIAFKEACAVLGTDFHTDSNTGSLVMPGKATKMPS